MYFLREHEKTLSRVRSQLLQEIFKITYNSCALRASQMKLLHQIEAFITLVEDTLDYEADANLLLSPA